MSIKKLEDALEVSPRRRGRPAKVDSVDVTESKPRRRGRPATTTLTARDVVKSDSVKSAREELASALKELKSAYMVTKKASLAYAKLVSEDKDTYREFSNLVKEKGGEFREGIGIYSPTYIKYFLL
jgi:hypothetical protein